MDIPDHIPSLAELALRYGTIDKAQFSILNKAYHLKKREGHTADFETLMISHKYATSYQAGLLRLLREYLIIQKHGLEFGKIAIEKGFATQQDIDRALEKQHASFKKAKIKKLIGDILVEDHVITVKQKEAVLREQAAINRQADDILDQSENGSEEKHRQDEDESPEFNAYEKQFLKIKVLDQEFAATVIEKGYASEKEVRRARSAQEKAFEIDQSIQHLDEIMVSLNIITDAQKELVSRELERRDEGEQTARFPVIDVEISEDQMEATVSWKAQKGSTVKLEHIKTALADKKITCGIYPDTFLQCHLDVGHTTFIAAKQDFSMELIKSRKAAYHFDTEAIDRTEKKRGETLAEQRVGCDAVLKKNLFGDTVKTELYSDFTFRCGSNVRLSKDGSKVFAGKSGCPALSIERKLFVFPDLHVLEDADLRYGALEPYANLNIKGILTGAYPVRAGEVHAEEIRGANIDAIGGVTARVGMTDAVISAQGDIRARYLHHCRIETFGNVYIENEIIDSEIFCSGKIDAGKCHALGSKLYAKKGISLTGAGNERTLPCILGAGTEHHILERAASVENKIMAARKKIDALIEKKKEQAFFEKKCFRKMVELKMFHDRAKSRKEKLTRTFQRKEKENVKKENLKNIVQLINGLEKRIKNSKISLRELNVTRKKYEREKEKVQIKINKIEPGIQKGINKLKIDLFAFYEWSRKQERNSTIRIHGKVFPGTVLSGAYSKMEIKAPEENIFVAEKETQPGTFEICPVEK